MRIIRNLMQFIWILSLLAIMFYLWQIDVSVGAMNCGGVVYQEGQLINPLDYYEHSISGVIIWGFINLMVSFYLIFFRAIWTRTVYVPEKRQSNKKPRSKK